MIQSKRNQLVKCGCRLVALPLALCCAPAYAQTAAPAPSSNASTLSRLTAGNATRPASDANIVPSPPPAAAVRISARGKTQVYFSRLLTLGTLVGPAFEAGAVMAFPPKGYPPEWKHGASAFGRNFGAVSGRVETAELGRYATGIALREDPRYYGSTSKNAGARIFHALGFTLVDRSDSGHSRPAFANFTGATAGAFVENAYLPGSYTDLKHTGVRVGIQMAGFAGVNLLQEFTPDLNRLTHALATRLHKKD